jgi:hypothetical protein
MAGGPDSVEAHVGGKLERQAERRTLIRRQRFAREITLEVGVQPSEVLGDELHGLERIVAHRARRHEAEHVDDTRRALPCRGIRVEVLGDDFTF